MPERIRTDSALELHLKSVAASEGATFPVATMNYYDHYCEIKRFIAENYYLVAGQGLALEGERFTLHNIDHVDDVIKQAGFLLGIDAEVSEPAYRKLHPYEVFVLLVAILLHDAGNAAGRRGHEKAPRSILGEMHRVLRLSDLEKRLIASIAQAHGGRTKDGNKDTIGTIVAEEVARISNVKVHGRRLAAILRLADELSEVPTRADPESVRPEFVLDPAKAKPPVSVIHNLFCKLININTDYLGKTISINFYVDKDYLRVKYPIREDGEDKEIFLIDYIAARIDKLEQERRYCSRYLRDFVIYDRSRLALEIHNNDDTVETITAELADVGYPDLSEPLKKKEPRFDGEALMNEYFAPETGE